MRDWICKNTCQARLVIKTFLKLAPSHLRFVFIVKIKDQYIRKLWIKFFRTEDREANVQHYCSLPKVFTANFYNTITLSLLMNGDLHNHNNTDPKSIIPLSEGSKAFG